MFGPAVRCDGSILKRSGCFVEARRYAERVNVVDHIEDRTAFVRTGATPLPCPDRALDLARGFEAGRALRAVLQEIQAAPRLALWNLTRLVRQTECVVAQGFVQFIQSLQQAPPLSSRRNSGRDRTTERTRLGYER